MEKFLFAKDLIPICRPISGKFSSILGLIIFLVVVLNFSRTILVEMMEVKVEWVVANLPLLFALTGESFWQILRFCFWHLEI